MSDKTFIDTNILVYAHDLDNELKHSVAKKIIIDMWESKTGVLSTQVLQEFYVMLTRKIPRPIEKTVVRGLIKSYLNLDVVVITGDIILHASEIEESFKLSFWDALIVSAAYSRNVTSILTEDLNEGQKIEGILIVNPFSDTL